MAMTIEQVAAQVVQLNTIIQQQQATISGLEGRLRTAETALAAHEDEILRHGRRGLGGGQDKSNEWDLADC